MKLVTYRTDGGPKIGKVVGNRVIDLCSAHAAIPSDMVEFLAGGPDAMARAEGVSESSGLSYALADVTLLAPILKPGTFLAIGMNYAKHLKEAKDLGFEGAKAQVWFNKQTVCVNGPYSDVWMPKVSDQLDYEVELAVVIGKRCKHVSAEDAPSVIAGYMVCNDFSVRDWQMATPTMTIGKSFDTHGPIGPWLVTADEVPDPHALPLRLIVNGEVRQEDVTGNMVANIWEQIEHLSAAFTLQPGDVIATGTPSGVAVAMKPPRYLKVGDIVRAEIDGIGCIENRIVAEPA